MKRLFALIFIFLYINSFSQSLSNKETVSERYFQNGRVKFDAGDYKNALKDFDNAIKVNPLDFLYYSERAEVYIKLKELDKAIKDLDKVVELQPEHILGYWARAQYYIDFRWNSGSPEYDMKMIKKAIEDCSKAILINPKNSDLYITRRGAYEIIGDLKNALIDCNSAIKLSPNNHYYYYRRAHVYTALSQLEMGLQDFDKAIRLIPNGEHGLYIYLVNRGELKYDLKMFEDAILDYNRAVEIDPTDSYAYRKRSLAKEALGKKDEADRDYQTSLKLDSKNL